MFNQWIEVVKHPQKREVLVVELANDAELSALYSIFLKHYPKLRFFSDDEWAMSHYAALSLNRTREYLGLTTEAVLFDIRNGFALDYFLSIAATIAAGGMLIILSQKTLGISESLRFHEEAIETPYFHEYLESLFSKWAYRLIGGELIAPFIQENNESVSMISPLQDEQRQIAQDFLEAQKGIFTLFAKRGSGKSWLGAKLISENPDTYILTAPNQNAIEQYQGIEGLQFRAPDALFLTIEERDLQPETLIIEEAAKMPLSHLERLCRRFNKVLMISSVENYEGTGQGLREKIHDLVKITKRYQLTQSRRFLESDPLKLLCDDLMLQKPQRLLEDSEISRDQSINRQNDKVDHMLIDQITYQFYNKDNIAELRSNLPLLQALYHLLNDTHYQTNIQDLRRLFDVPKQVFILAYYQEQLIGAIWAMEEGGLSPELTRAVFNGLRRPKGNLVAQMLVGQSYFPEAMIEKSIRISRISVIKPLRRLGIGQAMVQYLEAKVKQDSDFLSVSFGLTADLLQFWESLDYQIAHLGFHLDKTTGLHSAVVLKQMGAERIEEAINVSDSSDIWIKEAFRKFRADAALNCVHRDYRPEILQILQKKACLGVFDERDSAVIAAFRAFKRARHTVQNALLREKSG